MDEFFVSSRYIHNLKRLTWKSDAATWCDPLRTEIRVTEIRIPLVEVDRDQL